MPVQRSAKTPEAILHLQQQLDQWRGAQKGRAKHAGENLADVLKRRAAELAPLIHMSDAYRAMCQNCPLG